AQMSLYKISMKDFIKYADRYSSDLEKLTEKGTFVKIWRQVLPNAGDHEVHSGEALIPQLEKGQYLLVVKGKVNGVKKDEMVSVVGFQVSNLSAISQRNEDGLMRTFVLHRKTGRPISNASLSSYSRRWESRKSDYI